MNAKPTCSESKWHGRKAYTLRNDVVQLVTVAGGGHIAEFQFVDGTGRPTVNPLWAPPWKSIEPDAYRAKKHEAVYGTLKEGKLLSGIFGHNICLDYFGAPSDDEAAQGLSTHGEAPSAPWRKTKMRSGAEEAALTLAVKLPVAGLDFSREIRVRRSESVTYIAETVKNLKKADHLFHWTQHVTLGPPFVDSSACRVSLPGTRARTGNRAYGDADFLAPARNFHWPFAPLRHGGSVDLTHTLTQPGMGTLATVLLNPRRKIQYVAALNQSQRLLIGYCFRHADFPWVAIWEENKARQTPPWNGKAQTRGLEFGASPFPMPRRDAFRLSPLFDTPTFAVLPAMGKRTVKYASFLAHVPENFGWVRDIQVAGREIVVQGSGRRSTLRIQAAGLDEIFEA